MTKRDSPCDAAAPVLVPMPAERPYTYAVPSGMRVVPGSIVRVPLGPRQVAGIVWDGGADAVDARKLRPVEEVFDCPPIDRAARRFVEWIAQYTLTPPGMVARMLLRAPEAFDPEPWTEGLQRTPVLPDRMTAARQRVIDAAEGGLAWTRSGLAHAAGVSSAVIDGLKAQGAFETVMIPPRPVVAAPDPAYAAPELTPEQSEAARKLRESVEADAFAVTLLDGVTGSGKTEVYFEAVAAALEKGRQVLILLPEIALTHAFLERFQDRFGTKPAEWHSDVAPRMRGKVWRQVAEGTVRVVAGARSALFLPFRELGLIVVDEEHDPAYKQEDRVFYNARDMAVVRGHIGGFPVVLSSATPSVESRVNADQGRYARVVLSGRFAEAALPDLRAIDMRRAPPAKGGFLSPVLVDHIGRTLEKGEQSLLFLNRRGYAPLTLCRVCGHRFGCPVCSAWLVEHRFRGQLVCHHCGHAEKRPDACPECGTFDHLAACGPGVERVAEEFAQFFPGARYAIASSDTLHGPAETQGAIRAMAKREIDVLIGTQIVAKGHHFPQLTLVGVVDADLGGSDGDVRARERTFQLLHQVSGRAGRAEKPGLVLLQTRNPEDAVMQALARGDRDGFYEQEQQYREASAAPPFGRLAAIIVSGPDGDAVRHVARELGKAAPAARDVKVWGPTPAFYALLRGQTRERLLVQAARGIDIQAYLKAWLKLVKAPSAVRVTVDVDPVSFF